MTVRYAETDLDVIAIHRFLCLVAQPLLPGPIDGQDSAHEVWRCASDDVALMAFQDGVLVGTMGIVRPKFWWGKVHFLANRWLFVLPGYAATRPLLKEAVAIAKASGLELHIFDENKGRLVIFNKSKNRHVFR